ncbi:aldehyde dehydrogenase family protein [Microbacterium sp. X-17]|uniref:aldehyde dehydrogenase family protein n=1 Tax=Microbacterium sp. X-17 TaxID=3144404 RepID=UPI0031F484C8
MTHASRTVGGHRVGLQIDGREELGGGPPIDVFDPATEQIIARVPTATAEQVGRAVRSAHEAFVSGELGSPEERSRALYALADLIEDRADHILETVVAEVGSAVTTSRVNQIAIPVELLRGFAEAALLDRTEHLGVHPGPPPSEAKVIYRGAGVVAGITAYNVPLMFAAAKAGAALAAGCPTVLLPSPQAPLSILDFADYALEAGFPQRAVSVLAGGIDVAQLLLAAPEVARVSFTGSVPGGTAVMKAAADGVRGVVLELGGKSANILLPSADVAACAANVHLRYMRNTGQGCAAPTRILVHRSQYDEFLEASSAVFADVTVGDPKDPETMVGPVISAEHRQRVIGYIDGALADGARVLAQAAIPTDRPGWWVAPTLLGGLPNSARINQEEVFGPVATVQTYDTVDEAVAVANDSVFGLHASVFGDRDEALALAARLNAGHVTINGGGPVRGDAPLGGWKQSGIGRENGDAGVREFLEPVTVQWPAGS